MTGSNRLLAPVTAALNIREEYHKDVERRLSAAGLEEDILGQIITDVYAKDDIYFSLNRTFKHISVSFAQFCRTHHPHKDIPTRFIEFRNKNLYEHQAQAIESILNEQTTIISTGTGSGKTESFLVPILHHCLVEKGAPGIKAVILYPLNALANDQIGRIIEAVKGTGIRVGCFVGSTPRTKARTTDNPDELCISRKEMIECPPDILITNYVMLDRLITRPDYRLMFTQSAATLKFLVVDEVHYFRGTKGANLSLLLRRFRALCKQPLVQIGASGTLRSSGGYFPDREKDTIEQFARLIFGNESVQSKGFRLITPVFKPGDQIADFDPLPPTDALSGEAFLADLDKDSARELYKQLSGKELERFLPGFPTTIYQFMCQNSFVAAMRKRLLDGACTFQEFVNIFQLMYRSTYGREPQNPKQVVEAYWSLINYLNHRCPEQKPPLPLVLDYRLHIILGNIGDNLTRCLRCNRYHDGRCPRCRFCSDGLLFKVSKKYPNLCIAYFADQNIFPSRPPARSSLPVLVGALKTDKPTDPSFVLLSIRANLNFETEEESYRLYPLKEGEADITIRISSDKEEMQAVSLSEPRMYWHNVLKVVDGVIVDKKKGIAEKLLGFVDNRERASAIKLRLNDEIAERVLYAWALEQWSGLEEINLVEAFKVLTNAMPTDLDEGDARYNKVLREMPFWFERMLTSLDVYDECKAVVIPPVDLQPDEYELLNIFPQEGAIERSAFKNIDVHSLCYFHLEKHRVSTEFGIGLRTSNERAYTITSMGEQGQNYKELIQRIGSSAIQKMLDNLLAQGIIVQKTTPEGIPFYQLRPAFVSLQLIAKEKRDWKEAFADIECHTADYNDEDRAEIESRFSAIVPQIQALICTPTLEMGVDIRKLNSVLMIGFPPSPANYAQRAGRAGRTDKSRLATIVVLSSPENAHDEYYYAVPKKMIDGEVTPSQFTLTNFALLATHIYAHISAGAASLSLLCDVVKLKQRLQRFLEADELCLRSELQSAYTQLGKYLHYVSMLLLGRLNGDGRNTVEEGYRLGIFPDYGFRGDGLSLLKYERLLRSEDEDRVLTTREPEEAPRKLFPGRIVFCGGKAVKVADNQLVSTYSVENDPAGVPYRLYSSVVADEKEVVHIERRRDPESLYRLSRMLDIEQPLEKLEKVGPLFCSVHLVPQGTLTFINEGIMQQGENYFQALTDHKGEYRFGTRLQREGLLIRFADHILPSNFQANFLAALLRGIPDCFDLDDSELRLARNVNLFPQESFVSYKTSNYFMYGHDKSRLVPFDRIFTNLEEVLKQTLQTLEQCSCGGVGCYLCLFSLNSRMLVGRISPEEARRCLSVFLRQSLLKPTIAPAKQVIVQPDILLRQSMSGNQCRIVVQHNSTGKSEEYTRTNPDEDQNTQIYTALCEVLEREWLAGARTVKITTKQDHIYKQLLGENEVKSGREAFLLMRLALLKWQSWEPERSF
jgi:hypothetical protein